MIMSLPCVLALNSLQNAMMLIPCGPSAGPTGGAGLALPAASWSLTIPVTFLAMTVLLPVAFVVASALRALDPLLHLGEVELDRRGASEDRDLDAELLLVGLDLLDRAREVGERAVDDADLVARLERHARLGLDRPLDDALA